MKMDDSLWKSLLEDIFDDFLIFMFKEEAKIFDFDKGFEFLNNELAQIFPIEEDAEHPKFVDKLVKAFTKDGNEEWVLVHVEVQGYNDKDFAERMFTYFYRIRDKFKRNVTCIAIFTGKQKGRAPRQFDYTFVGTETRFKYNVFKIIEQDREALSKSNNPFASATLTVLNFLQENEIGNDNALKLYIAIAKNLYLINLPASKIRALTFFIRYFVSFGSPENLTKFDEEIALVTHKNVFMGIEELLNEKARIRGMEEGRQKTALEKDTTFVKSLLVNTDWEDERIAAVATVSLSFVREVRAALETK